MRRLAIATVALVAVTWVPGGQPGAARGGAGAADSIRDALGFALPLGTVPERIVSLSPNLTEILFAIGTDPERIAGVTRFCDEPPEARQRPRIGGIIDPSIERIVALRPDLILATRGNPVEALDRLRAAGLPIFAFESQDGLERILRTMETMVVLVSPDDPARADSVIDRFGSRLACYRATADTIPQQLRPIVYYYDPVSPDWTSGAGTHIDELITLAGGRNLAAGAPTAWPRYALEEIVARQPDWLLIAVPEGQAERQIVDDLRRRPGWRALRAVEEGRLCMIPAGLLLRPGPRLLAAVSALRQCLHPEQGQGCGS